MARKSLTNEEQALEFIKQATEVQLRALMRDIRLVLDVKYADPPAEKPARGRPSGSGSRNKPKLNGSQFPERTPGAATILGEPE